MIATAVSPIASAHRARAGRSRAIAIAARERRQRVVQERGERRRRHHERTEGTASIRYSGQWEGRAGHRPVRCAEWRQGYGCGTKRRAARPASNRRHHTHLREAIHGRRDDAWTSPRAAAGRQWGPYLSERQWGTVREDYSPGGTAWDAFSHDAARSRAYRWGEDGLFGISDDQQILCFALALWNGRDPILKERLFGLTNSEGNHGEDVKECYYYLDATPTHSYLKALYKYPQRAFPYAQLVDENRRRGKDDPEFELIDTGAFDGNRYFDVVTEYAKHSPSDILIRITVHNRGPEAADVHVLPQLWFRNTWSWGYPGRKPELTLDGDAVVAESEALGTYRCIATATRRGCSPRTRPTAAGCSDRQSRAATSRTRSTSASSRADPARSTRASAGPRPPRTIVSRSRRAATPSFACACHADAHADPFAHFDRLVDRRRRGGRRLLRPAAEGADRRISGWSSGRRWPA